MISAALMCLALNVYFEARNEPLIGQKAVAHVVLNRVNHRSHPDTVCEVVYQSDKTTISKEPRLHSCAMSWYCDGKSDKPTDISAWNTSVHIAYEVSSGKHSDMTERATHYHHHAVDPYWAHQHAWGERQIIVKIGRIGSHVFYRVE